MRFRKQRCWFNTQSTIIDRRDLTRLEYAEGVAMVDGFLVDHAWLVLDGNVVVDPTMRLAHQRSKGLKVLHGRVVGRIPANCCYSGVVFSVADIKQAQRDLLGYNSVLYSQSIAQRYCQPTDRSTITATPIASKP